jgi:hypothetical protein
MSQPLLIGWKEYVGFPDWGIRRVKAKVDTGARTSALDVAGYELRPAGEYGLAATLRLALDQKQPGRLITVEVPVLRLVTVSNSGGIREQRPLIEVLVRLGRLTKRIRLTLTNRASMRFRMILGREALRDDFVVDVSKKYLLRRDQ